MTARTVIDVQPLIWTVILVCFFLVIAGLIAAADRVIKFEIERYRDRRNRRTA